MATKSGICPKCGSECQLIFRWAYKHSETGKVVRAYKRPFPIFICNCHLKRKH